MFSMAVGTIGEWLKLVPFLLGAEQLILRGGGGGGVCFLPVLTHKKGEGSFRHFQ